MDELPFDVLRIIQRLLPFRDRYRLPAANKVLYASDADLDRVLARTRSFFFNKLWFDRHPVFVALLRHRLEEWIPQRFNATAWRLYVNKDGNVVLLHNPPLPREQFTFQTLPTQQVAPMIEWTKFGEKSTTETITWDEFVNVIKYGKTSLAPPPPPPPPPRLSDEQVARLRYVCNVQIVSYLEDLGLIAKRNQQDRVLDRKLQWERERQRLLIEWLALMDCEKK